MMLGVRFDVPSRRAVTRAIFGFLALCGLVFILQALSGPGDTYAQKIQADFSDKLRWGSDTGGVALACSADGRIVYVAGPLGVLVSQEYGKTGTWTMVLKGK